MFLIRFENVCWQCACLRLKLRKELFVKMKLTKSKLSPFLVHSADEAATIVCGPYLDNAGANGVKVRWTSDGLAAGLVRWGRAGEPMERETEATVTELLYVRDPALRRVAPEKLPPEARGSARLYEARLSGLKSGAEYGTRWNSPGKNAGAASALLPTAPKPSPF